MSPGTMASWTPWDTSSAGKPPNTCGGGGECWVGWDGEGWWVVLWCCVEGNDSGMT
jgi:hypothetical protein